ncbi:MAG: hypothetical protein GX590_03470 [Lentisphaerae bacterium]|nr:hypothetical protein [Lentisphaerota bacterium]
MKCELCQNAESETAIKMTVDGESRDLFVCRNCASRQARADAAPAGVLVEILFRTAFPPDDGAAPAPPTASHACPSCGMTHREFRKRSWLGCAGCYDHFAQALAPLLRDMHRGARHVGKVPRRALAAARREQLETELSQAVAHQQYEQAARLRDAIARLVPDETSPGEPHA